VSIKEKIKKIISSEDKLKPYSDEKIVILLSVYGINLARRTVAKYRESLNLESSSKRKTK
jgi:RNA polymerase sigma-54 factor